MNGDRYGRALAIYQATSREAWRSMAEALPEVDACIVRMIGQSGDGLTADEIEARSGLRHQTVSAQIRHMTEAGLLEATGARRPTRSGRGAMVWSFAQKAEPTQGRLF